MARLFILIPALTLLFSAQAQIKGRHIKAETVALADNFELLLGTDTTEVPGVYEQLIVKCNGKVLLFDSTTFYFFYEREYPLLLKANANTFDLLLETDGRPQANSLTLLRIKNDEFVQRLNFPMFVSATAASLDADSTLEYAGSVGFPELGGTYLPYSPIVYYELHPDGMRIDSTLTEERNAFIYGRFYGYEYREDQHQPLTRMKVYDLEMKRIKAAVEVEETRLQLLKPR